MEEADRAYVPEAVQGDSEALWRGQQIRGRLELGLVNEGRRVKGRIPD